jgi:hypothetical protein
MILRGDCQAEMEGTFSSLFARRRSSRLYNMLQVGGPLCKKETILIYEKQ